MSLATKLCWPHDRRRNRRTGSTAARAGRGGRRGLHMVGGPRRRHGARVLVPGSAPVPRRADAGGLRRSSPAASRDRRSWRSPRWPPSPSWSFLSITWADARGDAWDGANRTLLYLLVFAVFAALPWTAAEAVDPPRRLRAGHGGGGRLGGRERRSAGSDGGSFADGRLAAPIGYENASAALLFAAFWPAVLIASARSTPASMRGLLLATAGLLLGLAVLCQSRGSLIAAPAALAVALLLARERRRLLVALSAVGRDHPHRFAAAAEGLRRARRRLDAALGRAAIAIALSMALLAAAGLASARLDARTVGTLRLTRRGLGAALACALIALAIGTGLAVARARRRHRRAAQSGRASRAVSNPAAMTSGASHGPVRSSPAPGRRSRQLRP